MPVSNPERYCEQPLKSNMSNPEPSEHPGRSVSIPSDRLCSVVLSEPTQAQAAVRLQSWGCASRKLTISINLPGLMGAGIAGPLCPAGGGLRVA